MNLHPCRNDTTVSPFQPVARGRRATPKFLKKTMIEKKTIFLRKKNFFSFFQTFNSLSRVFPEICSLNTTYFYTNLHGYGKTKRIVYFEPQILKIEVIFMQEYKL